MVAQERWWSKRQEICIFRELFVCKKAGNVLFGPTSAYEISIYGIKLIFSSDDKDISPHKRHFRLTHIQMFGMDR